MNNKLHPIFLAALIILGGLVLSLGVSVLPQGPGGPKTLGDIAVADITVDKKDCRLWVTYQNTGTTTIQATLRERTSVQGVGVVEDTVRAFDLAPNAYFSHGVGVGDGYKLGGINKTVTAMIDVDNALHESNESNNTLTKTLGCSNLTAGLATGQVAGKPDLVSHLNFVVVTEGDNAGGHYVTFNAIVIVSNIGPGGAGPFDVLLEYRINNEGPYLACPTCKIHVSGISAGQYKQLEPRQFTKRGTQTSGQAIFFQATADCDRVITESDETNNVYKASYQSQQLHK